MDKPKVVFISQQSRVADLAFTMLSKMRCEIAYCSVHDELPKWSLLDGYDLGINFLGTHKIPAEEVKRPRLGWVNFHPAPLPEYRGRNLAYHAIMEGATEFGVTIHYMDEDYDTGPIIEVRRFLIEDWMTAGDLVNESRQICLELFASWIRRLFQDRVPATPQPNGIYYGKTALDDVVPLNEEQACRIRALTAPPHHHARLVIGGKKYKIVPEGGE